MKTCKRLSALFLMLCLLFSMIVPAVYADGESSAASSSNGTLTYRFGYQGKGVRGAEAGWPGKEVSFYYEGKDLNGPDSALGYSKSSYLNMNQARGYDAYYNGTGDNQRYIALRLNGTGAWGALKIYGVKAGTYDMAFNATFTKDLSLYVIPWDTYEKDIAKYQSELSGLTGEGSSLVAANFLESYSSVATLKSDSMTAKGVNFAKDGEYVLIFKNSASSNNTKLFGLTMTPGEAVQPPVDDTPSLDNVSLPVDSKIAMEDIVATVECERAAVDEVDGQDYLYLFFKGETMLVYNLDTGELVDRKTDVFTTPRDVYIDENDIVWACGAARSIYRYDPHRKIGTHFSFTGLYPTTSSFNVFGITGDGQGNLYFGTYDCAYIGKFNTETGEFSQISGHLNTDPTMDPDSTYSGGGGFYLKDGFAYLAIDGNKNGDEHYSHEIIKYDLANEKIVDFVDYSHLMSSNTKLPVHLNVVGNYLIFSTTESSRGTAIVDISGETMKLVNIEGMTGVKGGMSPVIDGKVYFMGQGNAGLLEMDVATGKVTATKIGNNEGLHLEHGGVVTINGMPGPSLLTYTSPRGLDTVDLKIYNLATGEIREMRNYTKGLGSGNQLRSIALSEDGKIVYVGAYGASLVVGYDVATGKKVQEFYTGGSQNDSLLCHNGYLYAGIYSQCSIGQYNPSTGKGTVLSQINGHAFYQNRVHAIAAGDGKVFVGTVPAIGHLGGALMWYNMEEDRIYVTVGPDASDVYYTYTGNTGTKNWYNAVTNNPADGMLDVNVDGKINTSDYSISIDGVEVPVYTGVIENQCINNIIYKDGYLICSTTRYGGSSSIPKDINARIFIYDVKAMEVAASYDITEFISGLSTPVNWIDAMIEDPDIPGKFWGVVSDTLFSFNVDLEKKTISGVQEELSLGKNKYTAGGCNWDSRDILFDGDFMYVAFGQNGTYMIERNNVKNYVQVSTAVPKQMVLAADGNIYYIDNTTDLKVLRIADAAQKIKDGYGVPGTTALINGLKDAANITLDDEAAVIKAREAYEWLSADAKKKVDITKLKAAEAAIAPLRQAADQAAVDAVQAKINAIGTVTLESETAIAEARAAYDALSSSQKAKVTALAVLTKAEAELTNLKIPAADKAAAAEVIAMINGIGKVTLNSKTKLTEIRDAYEELSPSQRSLVTNIEVLNAAEATFALLEEQVLRTYNFSYQTVATELGLKLNGNNLMNPPTTESIKNYYDQSIFNWYFHSYSSTIRAAQFDPEGYMMARSVPGEWVAFVINNPGPGSWSLSLNYFATHCGAEEMNVYIIPFNTENVDAALTKDNLVGVINCYDGKNITTNMDKPDNSSMKTGVMGTWIPGNDPQYIVVFKCEKASAEALANYEMRKESASDRGSNIYVAQMMMMSIDSEIKSVQSAIDNLISADKVTMRSKADIQAVRAKYEALGSFKKPYVDITRLVEAEKAYLNAAGVFNFSYVTECKALGLTSGSNNLLSSAFTSKLKDYRAKSYFNWGVKAVKNTLTEAEFSENGYLKLRSKPGDWAAFSITNPGSGPWKLSVEYVACATGAEEIKVYLLPADTADIEAALTDSNLLGTINGYDANNVPADGDNPAAGAYSTKELGYKIMGSESEYIVVFHSAKANTGTNAYNSNMYISKLTLAQDDAVNATLEAIDAIGRVTLNAKGAITNARAAYKALTAEQKALVTNLSVLVEAETKLAELLSVEDKEAASGAEALINSIGTVTLDSKIPVAIARKALDSLTDAQKALVSNTYVLLQAEIKLVTIALEAELEYSNAVRDLIDAIGTVTLESGPTIKKANDAYNALTDDQQRLVSNYDVLVAAKERYAKLKSMIDIKSPAVTDPVFIDFDLVQRNIDARADGVDTKWSSNTISNPACLESIRIMKEADYLKWNYKEAICTTSSATALSFDKRGYFFAKSTVIGQDYVAFFINNPGKAVWNVTISRPLGIYGATDVGVYILPQDVGDIPSELTEETKIGSYNCYKKGGSATPEKNEITSEDATFQWRNESGIDESVILVLRVDGATSAANARIHLAAMDLKPAMVETATWMIDCIETVTLDSEQVIANARTAYEALSEEEKAQVTNYDELTEAEAEYEKLLSNAKLMKILIPVGIVVVVAAAAVVAVVVLKKKKKQS